MTISSTTRIAGPFTGNGTASTFPFTFKVFAAADLDVVRLNSSTGVESTLVLNSDYSVTLNGDQNSNPGGSITLLAGALATGFTLVITSDIANLQPTDLTNQGGFYPEVITDALDRATIQIQQISDIGDRTIKIPITDGSLNMELPTADARANSFLAFDANGLPTAITAGTSGAPTTITRQVFSGTGSQTVFTLASDPGALGNSAQVYIGGVYQQRSTYTIAGTTLTFSAAPVAGTDNIEFVNFLTSSIGATSADLVTYTPAGSGVVARSAASKFGEMVSVKDFGAVGDGVTDDTAAIQAAINSGKSVFFPEGTYRANNLTQSTNFQRLYGFGNAAIVKNASGILLSASGNWLMCEGLKFDGSSVFTGDCVKTTGANCVFTNCSIWTKYGFGLLAENDGTRITGTSDVYFSEDPAGSAICLGNTSVFTNYHQIIGITTSTSPNGILLRLCSGSLTASQIGSFNMNTGSMYVSNCRIVGNLNIATSSAQVDNCTISGNVTIGDGINAISGVGFGPNVFMQAGTTLTLNALVRESSIHTEQLINTTVVDNLTGTAGDIDNCIFTKPTSYVPTWTATGTAPVLGNGTLTGKYVRQGRTVLVTVELLLGSTSTTGTGEWRFALPTTVTTPWLGSASMNDVGTQAYTGSVLAVSGQAYAVATANAAGGNVGPTIPFAWTTNDFMRFTVQYESV